MQDCRPAGPHADVVQDSNVKACAWVCGTIECNSPAPDVCALCHYALQLHIHLCGRLAFKVFGFIQKSLERKHANTGWHVLLLVHQPPNSKDNIDTGLGTWLVSG